MNAFALPQQPLARAPRQGTFHRLYDAGESIVRVAATPAMTPLMALECGLMGEVRARGLPVPACEFREVRGRGVHRVERVPGQSLETLDDDETRVTEGLGWAAQFLARLHRVRGTGYGPLSAAKLPQLAGIHAQWDEYLRVRLAEHVRQCEAIGAIDAAEGSEIHARFAAMAADLRAPPSALLHGDPGPHNFIVDARGLRGVIDWEDALLGDPLFDLASLATFQPERRHAAIVSAYGVELARGSAARQRFWLYFLRIALAKTVHRHRFGYTDRPGRAPAARRIALALGRLRTT
jgi:hygromycin-B 4-O-kinase